MRKWDPRPEWEGEDAYIVGGGPSLRDFDWGLLRGKNTIGCNSAFLLGVDVVKILVFADWLWWDRIGRRGTEVYGGRVVGCSDKRLEGETCPWLLTMDRKEFGLGRDCLGFNGNTGSLAINLALILGARRVFLLGFDMKLAEDTAQPNWHELRHQKGEASVYKRFLSLFKYVERELPIFFPGREVINLNEGSMLECFPKADRDSHFASLRGRSSGIKSRKERV